MITKQEEIDRKAQSRRKRSVSHIARVLAAYLITRELEVARIEFSRGKSTALRAELIFQVARVIEWFDDYFGRFNVTRGEDGQFETAIRQSRVSVARVFDDVILAVERAEYTFKTQPEALTLAKWGIKPNIAQRARMQLTQVLTLNDTRAT
jgi:hypothetical protein